MRMRGCRSGRFLAPCGKLPGCVSRQGELLRSARPGVEERQRGATSLDGLGTGNGVLEGGGEAADVEAGGCVEDYG
eukprot:CAMPEP_0196665008 /NCGR_PEP_ID=MMETSP1086-20130531/59310_1 /TAXON_ID=77921 /ORGANISM="Cyanoptyche  gloeocystis , Strain SAG4.97" /LENGTH=75 /DNA_ID=CAMNT_0042001563 /DNA_START=548 /DNA_END=771 /DNA_ORIENTATION=+